MQFRNVPFVAIEPESPILPEYELDGLTGELVQVGETDLEEMIQSSVDSALDRILDRFLEGEAVDVVPSGLSGDAMTDMSVFDEVLDMYGEANDRLEAIRDTFDLPISWDAARITKFLEERRAENEKKNESQTAPENG